MRMTAPPRSIERPILHAIPLVAHRIDVVLAIDLIATADIDIRVAGINSIPHIGPIANISSITDVGSITNVGTRFGGLAWQL